MQTALRAWVIAAGLVLAAVSTPLAAVDRTFSWHAEVVRVEGAVATLRVGLNEAAGKAMTRTPGAKLVLTWAAEGDLVVYAPPATDMASIGYGFLVEAELVSVEPGERMAVVKVTLPPEAATRAAASAGAWVKVTTPVARAAARNGVSLVAAPRPAPRVARVAAVAAGIDGAWTLTAVRKSGVGVGADCTFKSEGTRLSGTCASTRYGSTPIEGELKGSAVTFRYLQPVQGDLYAWKGELAPSGTALKGTVQVDDELVEFTGSK